MTVTELPDDSTIETLGLDDPFSFEGSSELVGDLFSSIKSCHVEMFTLPGTSSGVSAKSICLFPALVTQITCDKFLQLDNTGSSSKVPASAINISGWTFRSCWVNSFVDDP